MFSRQFKIYEFLASATVFIVSLFSIWQGLYSVDPHHWGLMLSNTKDLLDGLTPYKDVAIGYGILTPLIQGLILELTFQTLIAIQIATVFCYGAGLLILFKLANLLTNDAKLSYYILCSCVLIHPIVIYPWPNYVAFPFLLGGIFLILKEAPTKLNSLFSGFLLALATLTRPEFAILTIAVVFIVPIVELYAKNKKMGQIFLHVSLAFAGFIIIIGLFFLYLWINDLISYWFGLAWTLPRLVTPTQFEHINNLKIFDGLIRNGVVAISQFNMRWIVIYLMLGCNIGYLVFNLMNRAGVARRAPLVKASIISLLMLGEWLHVPEMFRVATGSIIGLITVYVLLQKVKVEKIFLLSTSIFFLLTATRPDSGNYFFPTRERISSAQHVEEPVIFKYQKWPLDVTRYYSSVERDMKAIKNLNCGIKYHFNYTMDVFLHVLSPFKKYQMTPFFTSVMDFASVVRPDILSIESKQIDGDILIIRMIPNEDVEKFIAPAGYFIYKKYLAPNIVFIPINNTLMLMVPEACQTTALQ